MRHVVIVGGGGHANDALELCNRTGHHVLGVLDDAHGLLPQLDGRTKRIGAVGDPIPEDAMWTLGVGYPETRLALARRSNGRPCSPLIDPSAIVAESSSLAEGSAVFWLAAISPGVSIGPHAFISYAATIGHDSKVGSFCSVMPGAHISGDVAIGDEALIGAGAVILQGVQVGAAARIGAGAVVTRNVHCGETATGIPARPT